MNNAYRRQHRRVLAEAARQQRFDQRPSATVDFRNGDAWAWWTLVIGNTITFGAPMDYDQIVAAIGPFEVLVYVAVVAIYLALGHSSFGGAGR